MRALGKAASDDDRPLIERVRRGDQDAARTLYERYFDRIYNYVYARLGRAEDAEDLAIDTMTRSLTRLDLFQDQGVAFSSWVYRIAHNATIDHYRRHGKMTLVPLDDATLPQSADPAEVAGAGAASANSLPDSALYPLKGVAERVRAVFAFTPSDRLTYHLDLAQTR